MECPAIWKSVWSKPVLPAKAVRLNIPLSPPLITSSTCINYSVLAAEEEQNNSSNNNQ
jgi:hypothetical protein